MYKPPELCQECKDDPNTAYPRDVDGMCLECGKRLCAHHLMEHFKKIHCIDIEWKGLQKEDKIRGDKKI